MDLSELVVVPNREPSLSEWQAAIDREDFLARIVIGSVGLAAGDGTMTASVDGRPVAFSVRPIPMEALRPAPLNGGTRAVAFSASGDIVATAACLAAALAYAEASQGGGYDGATGEVRPMSAMKEDIDSYLAFAVDRPADALARYPEGPRPTNRSVLVEARLAR